MNYNKLALPALALALAAASGSAIAGEGYEKAEVDRPAFDEIDANADGRVTRDEAMAATGLSESFDQLDANADGALTRDEYEIEAGHDDES